MKYRLGLLIFVIAVGLFISPSTSYAVNYNPSINKVMPSATPEATVSGKPVEVNSFEMFWPLAAGKTRADGLYFLKNLKENVRGWFIFGAAEKAEYKTLRATKRVLEAEALINDSKFDLAKETEASANNYLNQTLSTFTDTSDIQDELKATVKNRLDNLIKLVDVLNTRTKEQKDLNEQVVLTHTLIEKNLSVLTKTK